jgi:eukaryotic-like serine/threonine-protein kinase
VSDLAKIEEIYHAALEKTPGERAEFLAEICGSDDELRREVESLLAFEEQSADFIETPPDDLAAAIVKNQKNKNLIGKTLNYYRVLSLLGAGGMGEVYLAEDLRLERRVALKILPPELAENKERLTRFVREAKAASALNHPNIITIHEIGKIDSTHFIAAEYIEGETLRSWIKRQPTDAQTALDAAIQIVSALDAAHRAGITHRDIKPDNIMIRPDGLVKILDFGIAKLISDLGLRKADLKTPDQDAETLIKSRSFNLQSKIRNTKSTATGMIVGTAAYMSPEQAKGKRIDARSDIFSFGIVFYEMLTGRRAFAGESPLEIISSILKDEPTPIRQISPEVPTEIERIAEKTLRKNADERYQTAGELLTDLKNAKKDLEFQEKLEQSDALPFREEAKTRIMSAATGETQLPMTVSGLITAEFKKRKFGAAAISLVFLILLSAGVWLFFNRGAAGDSAEIDSIAVLPFQNLNGDADGEFLGDGLAETLINNFTKIPALRVTARGTAFRYRGRDGDAPTVGRELGVKAVLTGRITQQDDRLSIQVDLVNASDGTQILGSRYEGTEAQLLDLEQQIARDVAARLRLTGDERRQAEKKSTASAEAYEFYLRGRYLLNKRTADDLKRAIQEFKQAVDRDPNFALAYVGLANGYALLEEYAGTPATETLPQAKLFARRALELDDSLGEAYASLGFINSSLWEWTEAERSFQKALELSPNLSTANHWYCGFLLQTGRINDALREIKRAQELDPLSSIVAVNVGMAHLANGDADAAVRELEKIIQLDPNYWTARSWLGLAYLARGENEKAITELQKGVELSKQSSRAMSFLGYALAKIGRRAEALEIARELEEKYKKREATVQNLAVVYAGLGDKDRAFEWLEKNFSEHSGELGRIRWYPQFESLRGDARYQSLLERMGQQP